MTCIVGLVHHGAVYMGGDACGSNGHTYTAVHNEKVFTSGEHLMGCTGTFRLIDLLRFHLSVDPPREGADPQRYARVELLCAVKKLLDTHDYLQRKDGVASFEGPFLVGWRGLLWEVQCDLSVIATPPEGYSVGSGGSVARGALYATRGEADPVRRVFEALGAAEAVVTTVRRPFRVWRLDGGVVEELNREE